MPAKDPRVDAYIERSAPFARPILKRLRKVVHAGCPGVGETIKWGFPHFEHQGILCSMASFKAHCAFGFWQESLLARQHPEFNAKTRDATGQFGRLASSADLPDDRTLVALVRAAVALNESGARRPMPRRASGPRPLVVPADLRDALRSNAKAAATFEGFSRTNKRDYVEWLTEAKREATRMRRLETAVQWLSAGKPRNWKYMG